MWVGQQPKKEIHMEMKSAQHGRKLTKSFSEGVGLAKVTLNAVLITTLGIRLGNLPHQGVVVFRGGFDLQ